VSSVAPFERIEQPMPLPKRVVAVSSAVLGFFAMSLAGTSAGLCPYTCCKRAILGSIAVYVAASIAVGIINGVLTRAMIASQLSKDKAGVDRS
jgi:predicted cation transporter